MLVVKQVGYFERVYTVRRNKFVAPRKTLLRASVLTKACCANGLRSWADCANCAVGLRKLVVGQSWRMDLKDPNPQKTSERARPQ